MIVQHCNRRHPQYQNPLTANSKYPKGSSERGRVIKLILQRGYVTGGVTRSTSTLYKHVKKFEDKEQMREDVPPLPGDNGDVASTT